MKIIVFGQPAPQGGWIIYTLAGNDGRMRYVGVTKQQIRRRLSAHLLRSKAEDTHKDRWLRKLRESNGTLICRVVYCGVGSSWQDAERSLIARLRAEGFDLTNTTIGGEGCEGYRHSPEIRLAQAARRRGHAMPPERRSAISHALKGRKLSDDIRAKMAGRRVTEETRRRMSAAQKGHLVAPETLAKMSAARKGRPLSDRARASRPKTLSAVHRSAISVGLKRSARYAR